MNLTGEDVRINFPKIKNGIKGAIEFLKDQLNVNSLEWLPYPSMIVSLSAFFATDKVGGMTYNDNQRKQLIKWFWKSNFSRRYNAAIQDKHRQDIALMKSLSLDDTVLIAEFYCKLEPQYFSDSLFNVGSVNTKTFVLMLASNKPRSFISGAYVRLGDVLKTVNRNEFHHIFPKKHLERLGVDKRKINCLANFCFLNNADNQKIKDKDPKKYKVLLPKTSMENILESAICPTDGLEKNFDDFITDRIRNLIKYASILTK